MTANANAISVRLEPASAGQRAHDLRLGPQPEYVDEDRSKLNSVLIEPLTNEDLRAEWEAVKLATGKKGKLRSNQNLSYAGIITFGTEAQKIFEALSPGDQAVAVLDVAEKIAERFGTKLTGLVIHRDETAPHAHFQLRGIGDDGTVLSSLVKRAALRDVQTIAAEVMGKHANGIERGKERRVRIEEGETYADTMNRSVRRLHDDLPAEIAAKEAELGEIQAKLQTNLDRLAKARTQAAEEGDKAERARNRAETYEGRVQKAQEELNGISSELARLRELQTGIRAESQKLDQANRVKAAEARSLDEALAQKKRTSKP